MLIFVFKKNILYISTFKINQLSKLPISTDDGTFYGTQKVQRQFQMGQYLPMEAKKGNEELKIEADTYVHLDMDMCMDFAEKRVYVNETPTIVTVSSFKLNFFWTLIVKSLPEKM